MNDIVYVNHTTIQYILPAQLNCVGTDASNYYDEEPTEKERVFIECTEDLKGGEIGKWKSENWCIEDESTLLEEPVNYQREYVIPSTSVQTSAPSNPFANYQYSTIQPAPTPEPRDTSGLDILRNSYF